MFYHQKVARVRAFADIQNFALRAWHSLRAQNAEILPPGSETDCTSSSSPAANLLHLFLYQFLHLFLPPCLQVAVTVSLLQTRPSSVSPVQVQMLWHPWAQPLCPRFGSSRAMHCGSLMN